MKIKEALTLISALIITACSGAHHFNSEESIMEYATYIALDDTPQGFTAHIANPWKKNRLLHSYRFTTSEPTRYSFSTTGNTVNIPLKRVIVMTNSLARLMVELGVEDCIAGVCEPEHISDSLINARIAQGAIATCGNSMYPIIEKIMELNPDAIMVSPFEETGYGQLEKLGIPLLECADYMETSPLGRAEWIRFYGRLFGVPERSDSLFNEISAAYLNLCQLATGASTRPKVMLETRSGSAWYTAGGASTIGRMISDAGAEYLFADNKNSGSVPLSFETVYERASQADVWLLKNNGNTKLTYDLLEADFKPYASFKPFKTKNIWVCDVHRVPYFELTSFHPELLLSDFISIFHPEIFSDTDYTMQFYHPLDLD